MRDAAIILFGTLATWFSPVVLAQDLSPFAERCEALSLARRLVASGQVEPGLELLASVEHGPTSRCQEPPPRDALLFEAARLLARAGRHAEAAAQYRRLERGVLSDEALFQEGLAWLNLGDVWAARAALGRVSADSARFVEARVLLADLLVREGRAAMAVAALRDLLRQDHVPREVGRVRLALARALFASGERDAAWDHALDAYLHAEEGEPEEEAWQVLRDLGRPVRDLDRVLRRVVRADSRRPSAGKGKRLGLDALDPGLSFLVNGVMRLKVSRDPEGAVRALGKAREAARDPLVRAWATFFLAEAYVRADDDRRAADAYRSLRRDFPGWVLAARAAVAEARALIRMRELAAARAVLDGATRDVSGCGLEMQALWLQALASLMGSERSRAEGPLEKAARLLDAGDGVLFGLAERVRYFLGVVLWEAGRQQEGVQEMRRVARGYPHSYYGVLAVMRLREWGEEWAPPSGVSRADRSVGPLLLWRLGDRATAVAEMKARAHRGRLHEGDLKVLSAMLAQGRPERLAMAAQRYLRGWPGEGEQWLFEAAYPRPFQDLVEEAARETGVDKALLHAVMRAESGFRASARSPAGAVGLMQVMPTTARVIARRLLGDERLARRLWSPQVNVRLGARYLAELETHFRGHPALVLAGYNAGAGAARRFYERLRDLPTDVFVEAIPFSQTRAYLKRVIGLAAGYRAVAGESGQKVFEVPKSLPDTLGPFMEPPRRGPLAWGWVSDACAACGPGWGLPW